MDKKRFIDSALISILSRKLRNPYRYICKWNLWSQENLERCNKQMFYQTWPRSWFASFLRWWKLQFQGYLVSCQLLISAWNGPSAGRINCMFWIDTNKHGWKARNSNPPPLRRQNCVKTSISPAFNSSLIKLSKHETVRFVAWISFSAFPLMKIMNLQFWNHTFFLPRFLS